MKKLLALVLLAPLLGGCVFSQVQTGLDQVQTAAPEAVNALCASAAPAHGLFVTLAAGRVSAATFNKEAAAFAAVNSICVRANNGAFTLSTGLTALVNAYYVFMAALKPVPAAVTASVGK